MDNPDTVRLINTLRSRQRNLDELQLILDFLMSIEALENILDGMSSAEKNHLCRVCHLAAYEQGQVIFNKGEKSDRYFVIITGVVECVNIAKDETVLYGTTLTSLQTLGEKGIMTDHPRSLTVRTLTTTYLLCITAKDFKTYLERGILARFEARLNFVDSNIPAISAYTTAQKMNIVYALLKLTFKRNYLVLPPFAASELLYFVIEGECVLTVSRKGFEKKFVKLARGACFGDESVLINRRSEYGVRVTSEFADFFVLKKNDIAIVFLEETLAQLRKNCDIKLASRSLLTRLSSSKPSLPTIQGLSSAKRFPLASLQARKSLMKAVNRSCINLANSRTSECLDKGLSMSDSIKHKLTQLKASFLPRKHSPYKKRGQLPKLLLVGRPHAKQASYVSLNKTF
jgi:CRP-like cAMP-binding protein